MAETHITSEVVFIDLQKATLTQWTWTVNSWMTISLVFVSSLVNFAPTGICELPESSDINMFAGYTEIDCKSMTMNIILYLSG